MGIHGTFFLFNQLLVTNCHQSLLLYSNVISAHDRQHERKLHVKQRLTRAAHYILAPGLMTLIVATIIYTLIGFSVSFEAYRVYCLLTSKFIQQRGFPLNGIGGLLVRSL